jgi:hypothetical protein
MNVVFDIKPATHEEEQALLEHTTLHAVAAGSAG